MKQIFSSFTELDNSLNKKFKKAQEQTVIDLLDYLKMSIDRNVYQRSTTGEYKRTNEFLNVEDYWGVVKSYRRNRGGFSQVYATLGVKKENFKTYNDEQWTHSNIRGEKMTVSALAKVLNEGTDSHESIFGEPTNYGTDYWEEFLDLAEKYYSILFAKNCAKLEIDISSIPSFSRTHANQHTGAGHYGLRNN